MERGSARIYGATQSSCTEHKTDEAKFAELIRLIIRKRREKTGLCVPSDSGGNEAVRHRTADGRTTRILVSKHSGFTLERMRIY